MRQPKLTTRTTVYTQLRTSFSDLFFFFNDTATTEIYTLSLHDALPISMPSTSTRSRSARRPSARPTWRSCARSTARTSRSEEHTSELQSRRDLVCRLLLEKKKKIKETSKS